jgi:hypothetical protein
VGSGLAKTSLTKVGQSPGYGGWQGRGSAVLTVSVSHSAPPPVAWVPSGGWCAAALAGMRTVPLKAGPSLPVAATCSPVLPGTWATGVRCVREGSGFCYQQGGGSSMFHCT